MSGAAAIAAAKNRRGREDHNQRFSQFVQKCSDAKGAACPIVTPARNNTVRNIITDRALPPPQLTAPTVDPSANGEFDKNTLRILKPLQPLQVIQIHEQRFNKMDDTLKVQMSDLSERLKTIEQTPAVEVPVAESNKAVVDGLEEKISILEEVIVNLQMDLAKMQNFAIEVNTTLLKIMNERVIVSVPISPLPVIEPTPAVVEPAHEPMPALVEPVPEPTPAVVEPVPESVVVAQEVVVESVPDVVAEPTPAVPEPSIELVINEL
jgi:hypothetical protein